MDKFTTAIWIGVAVLFGIAVLVGVVVLIAEFIEYGNRWDEHE